MEIIKLENITYKYPGTLNNCIYNISLSIFQGDIISLMGPNGAGKTTLLKILCGLIKRFSGNLFIYGKPIEKYSNIEFAKIISYIPQIDNYMFDFSVEEIIAMGRRPYLNSFGILCKKDKEIIIDIANYLGINKIMKRKYLSLSGGEKRLVLIARALAQESSILLMDEPTTYLDLSYKVLFMNKLKDLHKLGKTIFLISHDLNLITEYIKRIIFIKEGQVILDGLVKDIVNKQNIEKVFGVTDFFIEINRLTGNPNLFFFPPQTKGGKV